VRLEIKVVPKSSRHEVVEKDGVLRAYLKAAPDKGKANEELVELVAERFGVKKRDVTIITGATSRKKIVEVSGK